MEAIRYKSEYVIEEVAGCGSFQVVYIICLYLTRIPSVFTMFFMMFGNYNPGWRCLDPNATTGNGNETIMFLGPNSTDNFNNNSLFESCLRHTGRNLVECNATSGDSDSNSCSVFDSCPRVEFYRDTTTIVSEWGLVCRKSWVASFIISLQMAGVVVGSVVAGYMADAFGRKKTIYSAQAALAVLNVVSIFSTTWEMYAVLRFILGFVVASNLTLKTLYSIEFVTKGWRGIVNALPEWSVSASVFSVVCMILKDWRQIHIATAILAAVGFVPVVWVPESLRWLEVKNKTGKFERAAKKITNTNGTRKPSPSLENSVEHQSVHDHLNDINNKKTYNFFHIFRGAYRKNSVLLGLPWFSASLITYAIGFGVKTLYGNFYINLLVMNAVSLPFNLIIIAFSNFVGRKKSAVVFCSLTAFCLIGAACFHLMSYGVWSSTAATVCVFGAKGSVIRFWVILALETIEIYPTAIRGLGMSWGYTLARTAGVLAPFLIPRNQDTVFIPYAIMALLVLICLGCLMKLPETKDKRLQEMFEQKDTAFSRNETKNTHSNIEERDELTENV